MAVHAAVGKGWSRTLTRGDWRVLWATLAGWTFDGYEVYALILVLDTALHALLPPSLLPQARYYGGLSIGLTLLGWACGGILGGIAADYIGRKRTMMYSVLAYAVLTGLTALSQTWWQLVVFRFLTGIGIGSEWATGATMIAETWPDRARAKGAGFMQSGLGFGQICASLVWLVVNPLGETSWRVMFLLGILPALLVFYIRSAVDEPARWMDAARERRALRAKQRSGAQLSAEEATRSRFTLAALFSVPTLRRYVVLGLAMSLSTTLGWWTIATWVPTFTAAFAGKAHIAVPQHWAAVVGVLYNLGAIVGYVSFGFIADAIGRKWTIAAIFAGAIVTTSWLYLWSHSLSTLLLAATVNGYFTLGQFAWFAVYTPELFPTSMRTTAVAFIFNSSRFLAFLGPIFAGYLLSRFGGFAPLATTFGWIYVLGLIAVIFMPETRGKPIPA